MKGSEIGFGMLMYNVNKYWRGRGIVDKLLPFSSKEESVCKLCNLTYSDFKCYDPENLGT